MLATLGWSGVVSWGLIKAVSFVSALRAEPRGEGRGLDVELHGEEAYGSGEGAILVLSESRPASAAPVVNLSHLAGTSGS